MYHIQEKKDKILEFAQKHNLCVVSTSTSSQPESALADFVITNSLEIIFNTSAASQKYRNIKANPKVSVIIGFGDDLMTLQYQGLAEELEAGDEGKVLSEHKDNVGFFRRWKIGNMRYFKIRPTWLRLSDFSQYPPVETEVNF